MPDHVESPAPPSRAALAAVLAQAAEAEPLLADEPGGNLRLQFVDLANGWKLGVLWHLGDQPTLWSSTAPDGAYWTHGCDRWPDWNGGPEAVVLEPLRHLLTPEQRERLRQRLLTCSCWPEPDMPPPPPPPTREQLDALWDVEVMAS
jgi:hypothetical protein